MPYFDGAGPAGYGPMTGRGLGTCGGGYGYGRGFGRGYGRSRGFAPCAGFWAQPWTNQQPTKKEELEMLKNEAEYLEEELKTIKQRIAELPKQK